MKSKLRKLLKVLFKYLRDADAKLIHALEVKSSYSPKTLSSGKLTRLSLARLKDFDKAAFADYFKDGRASLLLRAYRRLRNSLFLGIYRAYKRLSI